jgi:hypothetical protein
MKFYQFTEPNRNNEHKSIFNKSHFNPSKHKAIQITLKNSVCTSRKHISPLHKDQLVNGV